MEYNYNSCSYLLILAYVPFLGLFQWTVFLRQFFNSSFRFITKLRRKYRETTYRADAPRQRLLQAAAPRAQLSAPLLQRQLGSRAGRQHQVAGEGPPAPAAERVLALPSPRMLCGRLKPHSEARFSKLCLELCNRGLLLRDPSVPTFLQPIPETGSVQ